MLSEILLAGPGLYRGPQPDDKTIQQLRTAGILTVVNLRAESEDSRHLCKRVGLVYEHIPVVDWTVPHFNQVDRFLSIMEEPAYRPVYVHCYAGVGRTGLFVSCWRIAQGMGAAEAIRQSDVETPLMGMSKEQRQWLHGFEFHLRSRG